MTYNNITV